LFSNLLGDNYSEQNFAITLTKLKKDTNLSIRALGEELGMDKMLIHRLLTDKQKPSLAQIELVAEYFNKQPSYFLEWRIAYVITFIYEALNKYTESSVIIFKKLKPARK
jgi:transcriptional regulator with XRE-family HTH domain